MTTIKPRPRLSSQQSVSFYLQNNTKPVIAEIDINDTEEMLQAIRIALKTEYKDTYNYNVGSKFYQLNHTIYKTEESLEPLQQIIYNVAKKFFPNCVVTIDFEEGDGYFWCQTIVAKIYDEDELIASFEI